MKREGILTDWLFFSSFFASVKRETVNISAGVFSLSKASRSKVKFTKYFFCSAGHQFKIWRGFSVFSFSKVEKLKAIFLRETHNVDGPSRYGTFNNLRPVCLTVYQTRVVCEAGRQRLWNEWFLLHVLLSWSVWRLSSRARRLSCIQSSMSWPGGFVLLSGALARFLQSHNPNCVIPQKGIAGSAPDTNDSCSLATPSEIKN